MCWTAYADVNALIETTRLELQAALREKLVGLYIFGSLATGNFEVGTSDVDLLVVLRSDLNADQFKRVSAVHDAVLRTHPAWENRLEIAYIALGGMRRIRSDDEIAVMSPGEPFHFKEAGNDWFLNLFMLRELGVTVFGPSPRSLVDPVSRDDLASVVRLIVLEWREWITQTELIHLRSYQGHIIITMCRNLVLCREQRIASKREATGWTEREFPEWAGLIRDAIVWRQEPIDGQVDQDATLPETLRFVHFAIDTILAETTP